MNNPVLDVLAMYDLFQLANHIKGDYCNAAGLEIYLPDESEDPDHPWLEYYDPIDDLNIDDLTLERCIELDKV